MREREEMPVVHSKIPTPAIFFFTFFFCSLQVEKYNGSLFFIVETPNQKPSHFGHFEQIKSVPLATK